MIRDRRYIRRILLEEDAAPEGYLARLPVVRSLRQNGGLELRGPVTFFVGENGSGKSTLLEAVAVAFGFNAEGGSRNFRFSTHPSHSELHRSLRLVRGLPPRDGFFLRAESFYNVASYIEELDQQPAAAPPIREVYGGKSLHEQSHGESFLSLALHRLNGEGLYILDEPEAALSPARQLTLLARLHQLARANSQLIIATHSPILMACPEAEIYVFDERGITLTPYEQTEHYLLTRRFLNQPQDMLRRLLWEETGERGI
ncbi:MAG: AAA family ATPase [Clostridiales bacterium]|nr:AAA family ATPase [Clostridiales bacterium]